MHVDVKFSFLGHCMVEAAEWAVSGSKDGGKISREAHAKRGD